MQGSFWAGKGGIVVGPGSSWLAAWAWDKARRGKMVLWLVILGLVGLCRIYVAASIVANRSGLVRRRTVGLHGGVEVVSMVEEAWLYVESARNNELHGELRQSTAAILEFVSQYVLQYNQANSRTERMDNNGSTGWSLPMSNVYKDHSGGIEVVIRNHLGQFMGGGCFKRTHVGNAFLAEALAARSALELAHELGFTNIVLEGDALGVLKSLKNSEPDLSAIGTIVEEARRFLSLFHNCEVCHVNRWKNQAAHHFAKYALQRNEDIIWVEDCPNFLLDVIHSEYNSNHHQ
ncbi:hypothetical protein REPUB_Repub07fG0075500 [Reevesia pubescens]